MTNRSSSVLIAAVFLLAAGCSGEKPQRNMTTAVTVTPVRRIAVPFVVATNGVVEPLQTVSAEAQVGGILRSVAFSEGQDVTVGQVLFQIDSRPYVATLNQMRAQLARDQAQATNSQRDAARYAALVQQGYVTQSQADQATSTAASAAATVQADHAAVAKAEVDVANCTIRAPITGRTGGLLVRQGNLVKANSETPLVVINQIQPILVRFTVPQGQLPDIQRYYTGGKTLLVRATPSEGSAASLEGVLSFMDNSVDAGTGTVLLKAKFTNAEGTLWPGQFVKVGLQLYVDANALTVPIAAVMNSQQGTYVFTVEGGAAKQRPIEIARTVDSLSVVGSGLKEGEKVVLSGQSRLTSGAKVAIKEDVQ